MDKLGEAYFFNRLEADELERLKSITRIVVAKQGDIVLRQGKPSDDLFIVRSGSVRVMLPGSSDDEDSGLDIAPSAEQTLVVLGTGECFGEFAFVDRKASSATVIVNEDSSLYAIFHNDLDALLEANPTTGAKIYKALLGILVGRFRNTDIELAVRRAVGD